MGLWLIVQCAEYAQPLSVRISGKRQQLFTYCDSLQKPLACSHLTHDLEKYAQYFGFKTTKCIWKSDHHIMWGKYHEWIEMNYVSTAIHVPSWDLKSNSQ